MSRRCGECGAPLPESGSCQAYLHELLVVESMIPGGPTGMAHFFAVASFNLQHPSQFTPEVVQGLRRSLDDAVQGRADLDKLRRRGRYMAEGATRVLRRPEDTTELRPAGWPTTWPMTALDVCRVVPEQYNARAGEWAESVSATLARALPVADVLPGTPRRNR